MKLCKEYLLVNIFNCIQSFFSVSTVKFVMKLMLERKTDKTSVISHRFGTKIEWILTNFVWADSYQRTGTMQCMFSFTVLAELGYNNLLLRHFQLFIFPSVVCVNQLCLGFTLHLKCRAQKLGLDSRLQCSLTGLTGLFSFDAASSLREAFHRADPYVNLSNICNEQAFHSTNLLIVVLFIVSQEE